MPDLERADAGLAPVAFLQRRDVAAALVAQLAQLVELRQPARAHEAAVARQQRRVRRSRLSRRLSTSAASGDRVAAGHRAAAAGSPPTSPRRLRPARQPMRARASRSRGPPRAERQARRAPAPRSGQRRSSLRAARSQRSRSATRHSTWSSRRADRLRLAPAVPRDARPAAAPPALVTVRSIAASSEPLRVAAEAGVQLQIAPRRRVDQQDAVRLQPPRPVQPRQEALLGQLEIAQQRAGGARARPARRHPGRPGVATPNSRAEPPFGGDAVEARGGSGVTADAGSRRHGSSRSRQQPVAAPESRPAASARQCGRELAAVATGSVRNAPVEMSTRARPSSPAADAIAASQLLRRGSSRPSSVSVPAVTMRTTSRRTRARPAAPAGLGRVLELLADRDLEALADQPVQVELGAVHRHAAHRDVLAARGVRVWSARCPARGPPPRASAKNSS